MEGTNEVTRSHSLLACLDKDAEQELREVLRVHSSNSLRNHISDHGCLGSSIAFVLTASNSVYTFCQFCQNTQFHQK